MESDLLLLLLLYYYYYHYYYHCSRVLISRDKKQELITVIGIDVKLSL